jgi:Glycosyltransferase WbsX
MTKNKFRAIAIHLPQFHPTPENDLWWGKGFTEWTNVTKAKPLFKGHYQPHLPADLGYYDLRLEQARKAQAEMARQYGIEGFCYYHYWFNGKRLLHEPVDEILKLKKPDFPFMLCWANENWTRRWDGNDQEVLIEQKYSQTDDIEHIRWLCENVFSDNRYITVNGAPVFAIYKSSLFPDIKATIKIWRDEASKLGFPKIYLCGVQSNGENYINPTELGFDAAIDFQPDWAAVQKTDWWSLTKYKYNINVGERIEMEYDQLIKKALSRSKPNYKQFPCITPNFDNSSRKKKFVFLIKNATPAKYLHWFREILKTFVPFSPDENFVFINAWNEWAEGNHLEPDRKFGLGYLEATKEALQNFED